jgi:rhomboid protease GluP
MLVMDTVDEVSSPKSSDATPLPRQVGEIGSPRTTPTPTVVLGWIANATGKPWFPSQHAAESGTDRDSLDEPLSQLRVAGLIRIATWVRLVGQGYVLTPTGEKALATGGEIPPVGQSPEPLCNESFTAIPDDQPMPLELQSNPVLEEETNWLPIDPRPPVVVPVLLIANVAWYFVGLVAAIKSSHPFWTFIWSGDPDIAHRFGSVAGADLLRGEWWRLLTSCFIHGNFVHLVVILFALAMIGPLAELVWGRWRFAVIYLLSGLAGSSLAMILHPQDAIVGAS